MPGRQAVQISGVATAAAAVGPWQAHRDHGVGHRHAKGLDGGLLVHLGVLLHAVLDPLQPVGGVLGGHLDHLRLLALLQLQAAPLPLSHMADLQRQPDLLPGAAHIHAGQLWMAQPAGQSQQMLLQKLNEVSFEVSTQLF